MTKFKISAAILVIFLGIIFTDNTVNADSLSMTYDDGTFNYSYIRTENDGNIEYSNASITGLTDSGKNLSEITIPATVKPTGVDQDLEIVAIPANLFNGSSTSKVTVKGPKASIPDNLFSDSNISTVSIEAPVNTIPSGLFKSEGNKITTVTISSQVTSLPDGLFSSTGVKNVTINSSLSAIPADCFSNASKLEYVKLPNTVTSIGSNAFAGCSNLNTIDLSMCTNLASVGTNAFLNCTHLPVIEFPQSMKTVGSAALKGCTNLSSVKLPGVTTISQNAFENCTAINGIVLPDGLETLGSEAFKGCTGLSGITVPGKVGTISISAFNGCTALNAVTLGAGITVIDSEAFRGCTKLSDIVMPSVKEIGQCAFESCTSLKKLNINKVEKIYSQAFKGCTGLNKVVLGEGQAKSIGPKAFEGCVNLGGINIPVSINVDSLSADAFDDCKYLTIYGISGYAAEDFAKNHNLEFSEESIVLLDISDGSNDLFTFMRKGNRTIITSCKKEPTDSNFTVVTIPDSIANSTITELFKGLFKDYTLIKEITLPSKLIKIPEDCFNGCTSLESISMQDEIKSIDARAFYNCTLLSGVSLPSAIESVGDYAFYNCEGMKSVNTYDCGSFITIGDYAFYGCDNESFKMIDISHVLDIGKEAFSGCSNLSGVDMSSLQTAGNKAFSGCGFDCLSLPAGLDEVSVGMFSGCTKLTTLEFPSDTEITVMAEAFKGCKNLGTIYFPSSVSLKRDSFDKPEIAPNLIFVCHKSSASDAPYTYARNSSYNIKYIAICESDASGFSAEIPESIFTYLDGENKGLSIKTEDFITDFTYEAVKNIKDGMGSNQFAFFNYQVLSKDELNAPEIKDLANKVFKSGGKFMKFSISTDEEGNNTLPFNTSDNKGEANITVPYTRPGNAKTVSVRYIKPEYDISEPQKIIGYNDEKVLESSYDSVYKKVTFTTEEFSYIAIETELTSEFVIPVTGIEFEGITQPVELVLNDLINPGADETAVTAVITPDDADDKTIEWTSSDEQIATVEQTAADKNKITAKIKAVGPGHAIITASTKSGDHSVACNVTVISAVESIEISPEAVTLDKGETKALTVNFTPEYATNKGVTWTSSDTGVATVDKNGTVTAVRFGTAVITATSQDETNGVISAGCNVTVNKEKYTVEFDTTGGSSVPSQEIEEGGLVTKPADPKRNGYFFKQWYLNNNPYDFTQPVTDNLKLTAVWEEKDLCAAPKFDILTGSSVVRGTEVRLSCDTPGAKIYYTINFSLPKPPYIEDGSLVTDSGTYEFIESIVISYGVTIKAIATDPTGELADSSITIASYKIKGTTNENGDVPDEDIPKDGVIKNDLWVAAIPDQTYTGSAIKPEPHVYNYMTRLKAGRDYTVAYANNTEASEFSDSYSKPTVIISGKGSFSGTTRETFNIYRKNIADNDVIKSYIDAHTVGSKNPDLKFSAKYNKKTLRNNKDYSLTVYEADINYIKKRAVSDYSKKGNYVLTVSGTGSCYKGSVDYKFTVDNMIPISSLKFSKIPAVSITSSNKTPEPVIKDGSYTLVKDKDYSLDYKNYQAIGTATLTVNGLDRYFGTKTIEYPVNGLSIKKAAIKNFKSSMPYTGNEIMQPSNVKLMYEGVTLVPYTDYTISYSNNRDAGKASVTYTGIGRIMGSVKKTFTIMPYDITKNEGSRVKLKNNEIINVNYSKGGAKPHITVLFNNSVTLTEGTDYTLSYANNNAVSSALGKTPMVTVKGKGNFKGTLKQTKPFYIKAKGLSDVTVMIPDAKETKKPNKFNISPVLVDSDGAKLKAGTDFDKKYVYTYKANTTVKNGDKEYKRRAGELVDPNDIIPLYTTISVKINSTEKNYTGSVTGDFRIVNYTIEKAKANVLDESKLAYTGEPVKLTKDNIEVFVGGARLENGQYDILEETYRNNIKVGTASVTIRGRGIYGGYATIKFKVNAKSFSDY